MAKKGKLVNKVLSIVWNVFSYLFLTVLVLVAGFLVFYISSSSIAKAMGKRPIISLFTIVSPSMEPTINVYDVIVDTRIPAESEVEVGDIVTFYSDAIDTGGYTVTHRINQIINVDGELRYITKGDNNQNVDAGYITFKDIVGKKIMQISGLGRIQVFIASKLGWAIVILIPALFLVFSDILKLKKIYKIKREIEVIPEMSKVEKVREQENNKKIRSLVNKAQRINNKNKR